MDFKGYSYLTLSD